MNNNTKKNLAFWVGFATTYNVQERHLLDSVMAWHYTWQWGTLLEAFSVGAVLYYLAEVVLSRSKTRTYKNIIRAGGGRKRSQEG